jgi:hypothetical protein
MDNSDKQKVNTDREETVSINSKQNIVLHTFITTSPKKLGNCYALCYKNGNPLVTIGPNCNDLYQGPYTFV